MLCSEVLCQTGFNSIPFSYKIRFAAQQIERFYKDICLKHGSSQGQNMALTASLCSESVRGWTWWWCRARIIYFTQVFLKSFCMSQFLHKFVSLFFIRATVKDKLNDLRRSRLLQNDFLREIRSCRAMGMWHCQGHDQPLTSPPTFEPILWFGKTLDPLKD